MAEPATSVQNFQMYTEKYGLDPSQEGDLYIPNEKPIAVLCLFHGGFWRMPYDREQLTSVAIDLVQKGFAVWNVEYRRIGAEGGGWRGTLDDAVASVNHLRSLCSDYSLSANKVVAIGHSAGGQLAIWLAKQYGKSNINGEPLLIKLDQVIGLAPVINLAKAVSDQLGNNSVLHLLGGSPEDYPERYASCDPMRILPTGVPQLILHGSADDALPIQWTRDYVNAARMAGENTEYIEVTNGGHMDYVDPGSEAASVLVKWLVQKYK